ncbi:hypothetical protein [Modestobacter roseus]|uniref:ABC-2 type transport system permease protein n=1 Tax=Modestobacter roseus TaxID=1181884 RepID=A0A562IWF8_9ACTN|nr:hypothetical protein [Modestobacter roseus]MQA35989.1 hypothetical protein [Modestobacter roseus]TWH75153.1 hypothetical protein JD78_03708 [Modestobacter roseus]
MNRTLATARMHLVHPLVILGIPWLVVGISFAINLAVWALGDLESVSGGEGFTGGLASLYITVLVVFAQGVTQMFPFAMGVSISRRTFYLGTALVAAGQALGYGVLLTVLQSIESATAGWGIGLPFWAPGPIEVGNPALQVVVYALPMLACAFLGMAIGVVLKRWGASGMWMLAIGTLVLLGIFAIVVTGLGTWPAVGSWLVDRTVYEYTLVLPALAAVALAGLSWTGLRRAVP